jgi:outer membrane protein, multidrug efflux system
MAQCRVGREGRITRRTTETRMKNLDALLLMSAILVSIVMTGCMVGPNYHRPVVATPSVYRDMGDSPQAQAQAASFADLPWWQVFQDQQLQELIRTALKENYDLQMAAERIGAARGQVAITRSSLFPQVQANANFSGGKDPSTQSKYNILGLTADAAFQLDLFGRLRRASEASRAQLLATEDARQTGDVDPAERHRQWLFSAARSRPPAAYHPRHSQNTGRLRQADTVAV